MQTDNQIPAFKRLSDSSVAQLLGITVEEYQNLSHLPIEADTDINGEIIGFHMRISSNNNPRLLSKLDHDKNYIIKLKPDQIYKTYIRH